jgi:intracellular sulfur oxidation DsrE/DsrF family protein
VVRRFQFKRGIALLGFSLAVGAYAESLHTGAATPRHFIAQIEAHTPHEISDILMRLDGILQSEEGFPTSEPLALVLHGEEVRTFLRENYADNREIVDLAARLDAFNAIDIQVCETWLRGASITKSELPAFVDTVPYGPAQEKALIEQGYEYF